MFCNSTKPAPEARIFRREVQFLLLLCNKSELYIRKDISDPKTINESQIEIIGEEPDPTVV